MKYRLASMGFNTDFAKFKREFLQEQREIEALGKELIKESVMTGYSLVVDQSPVDTGRYKASHVFGTNKPGKGQAKDGLSEAQYDSIADETEKAIDNKRFPFKSAQYFINNNLIYAPEIEAGHSKDKAPNGVYAPVSTFIQRKVDAKINEFNRKKVK